MSQGPLLALPFWKGVLLNLLLGMAKQNESLPVTEMYC